MKLLIAASLFVLGLSSQAFAGVQYGETGWINSSQSLTYQLPCPTYIDRVDISASGGWQSYNEAKLYVDGQFVSRLGVPGYDPRYPVTIRQRASVIEIRGERGAILISEFRIVTGGRDTSPIDPNSVSHNDRLAELGDAAFTSAGTLLQFSTSMNPAQNAKLIAIRVAAMKLTASSNGRGEVASPNYGRSVMLRNAIAIAQPLLEQLAAGMNEEMNSAAQTLLTVKDALEHKVEIR